VTNNTLISKHELLKLFQKHTKKDIKIKPVDGNNVDKGFIDTRLLMNYKIPSYDQMITEMVEMMIVNKSLYSQYEVENFGKE
jgi:dTDP-4-dehydrorhamnose reductase